MSGELVSLFNDHDDMVRLAHSFPTLRGFRGPWNIDAFRHHARGLSHGGRAAAAFVLSVWNPVENKKPGRGSPHCGLRFDLQDALGVWDSEHRAAFVAWAREPWWP